MKFQFDPHQAYQEDAINAVADLFRGQPADNDLLYHSFDTVINNTRNTDEEALFDYPEETVEGALGNNLLVDKDTILKNLQDVQNRNALDINYELVDGLQFDIEMETGTGKTYVYLRTAFELARKYGFMKYIILVPSVAIREGVKTSLQLMSEHFKDLYPDIQSDVTVYSGDRAEDVRSFATATSLQFMIMTIDSLRGDKNTRIIHQTRDQLNGLRPLDYLRDTRPIVIMDEPQNMETGLSQSAVYDLNPLCMLRYSATHRKIRNLVYRLDPVDAHELGLVKQIVIADAVQEGSAAKPYVRLVDVQRDPFTAKVELLVKTSSGTITKKIVTVKNNDDLEMRSNGNAIYADNWRVSEISVDPPYIELSHHGILNVGEEIGGNKDAIFKEMIRETIREHLRRARQLQSDKVKVLSLFFIDHVSSYLGDGTNNSDADGQFAQWFDEIYQEERPKYEYDLPDFPSNPRDARSGYFAQMTKGRGSQKVTTFKDSNGKTRADDDAYELIMKDKARLLSPDEPVRFIFSHSALREGWDNPNVFQICTLRDMTSETERRQTIGRGLRLPVDENGKRLTSDSRAQLTVIANESYAQFASALQQEYKDAGVSIGFVRHTEFAKIPIRENGKEIPLGVDRSRQVWDVLRDQNYLEKDGTVSAKFQPDTLDFALDLPDEFDSIRYSIIETVLKCKVERFIKPQRSRKIRKLNKEFYITPEFEDFWRKISQKTTYRVSFDSSQLIDCCVRAIKAAPAIEPIRVVVTRTGMSIKRGGPQSSVKGEREAVVTERYKLPNVVAELQDTTSLTRQSIIEILQKSGRLAEFISNPNDFIAMVKRCIHEELSQVIIEGIQYEPMSRSIYELRELQADGQKVKEFFDDNLYKVHNPDKTDFNYVLLDSEVERQFAQYLDDREDISLFMKLPDKFRIPTPVGDYNPDWAIIKKNEDGDDRLYLIRETKGTIHIETLRPTEQAKIEAARKHFAAINVDYNVDAPVNGTDNGAPVKWGSTFR